MTAIQLIEAIKQLPLAEQLLVIELIFKNIREKALDEEKKRRKAAEQLLTDYQNDEELTAFTALDKEDFYEPR